MLSIEEWRKILDRKDLSDDEIAMFVEDLRKLLSQFLDVYFLEEFEPDEV